MTKASSTKRTTIPCPATTRSGASVVADSAVRGTSPSAHPQRNPPHDAVSSLRSYHPAPRPARPSGEGGHGRTPHARIFRRRRSARRPPSGDRNWRERYRRGRGERAHAVRAAARESRHRRFRDRWSRERMKVGIVRFPGSNCEDDAFHAVVDQLGEEAVMLWHKDHDLQGSDVVILPGGFSYGDYLRAGAIARFSPIMREVALHAAKGGIVLGICNGFQIACEAGLLPGALLRNDAGYRSMPVTIRVEHTDTAFTSAATVGQGLTMPLAQIGEA